MLVMSTSLLVVSAIGEIIRASPPAARVFVPPRSGRPFDRYFGFNGQRAAIVGNRNVTAVVAFTPYGKRHQNAALRWIASVEDWGEAYNEVTEFVLTPTFLYNSGWYPGGADNMYHPAHFGWDLERHFASVRAHSCTIRTPDGLFDLTPLIDPRLGEPYALSIIPPYPYQLHFEGDLVDDDSGTLLLHYVHDQRWNPPTITLNPHFHGRQRQSAIRQTESWSDGFGMILDYSGASYAFGLGCFWQVFSKRDIVEYNMLFSWTW
jgi:hypothetical protein